MAKYDSTSRYLLDTSKQTASRSDPQTGVLYTLYRVKAGDTMEVVAARHFGDPLRWWELADVNPHIKFPMDLNVGDVLRLPR
jgi:nucleoid-associated protein YgaU